MNTIFKATLALAAAAALGMAQAAPIVLDFEGIGNMSPVGNYYNGGAGTNHGIAFSTTTLALVDSDAGGSGNTANEPSGETVMFFMDSNNAVLNFASGFDTGFSFYYASSVAASVKVWSEVGATGKLLGTLNLLAQHNQNCTGDPSGGFCNWSTAGLNFAGVARSIDFGGTANQTTFDNITFGSSAPLQVGTIGPAQVPEPGSLALAGLALAALFTSRRRQL